MKLFIDTPSTIIHLYYTHVSIRSSVRLGQGTHPYFQYNGLTPISSTIYL